ncbi:MAG: hypothetical protein K9N49_00655 [Candidatus Marinimicrobia bacterium]|nr:hypothetical protein [Candidatus Neomarinimicrobiota bacterium]
MERILADGQYHYAFHVVAAAGRAKDVAQTLKGWKANIRAAAGFGVDSVEALAARVQMIPGVARVIPTGPRSALPLALRMACGLTDRKGDFVCHKGTGFFAERIVEELRAWNIAFHPARDLKGDMPLAFIVLDPANPRDQQSAELFPLPRTSYQHRSRHAEEMIEGAMAVLLNRVNDGILETSRKMMDARKLVSLRIHGYSRHVKFEDYRPLLPLIHHLILDSGHGSLRETARALNMDPPKGWPDGGGFRTEFLEEMAKKLNEIAGKSLLYLFIVKGRDSLYAVGRAGSTYVRLCPALPPGSVADLSVTARSHGASVAAALDPKPAFELEPQTFQPGTQAGLQAFANWVYRAAYHGLLNIPWTWPERPFDVPRPAGG